MKGKFRFYEVVKVNKKSRHEEVAGLEGTILGMAANRDRQWYYAVAFNEIEAVWCFSETELSSTGKMNRREDFYDGTHISAAVDKETGEGIIKDRNECL
jgi:hypothetical protein